MKHPCETDEIKNIYCRDRGCMLHPECFKTYKAEKVRIHKINFPDEISEKNIKFKKFVNTSIKGNHKIKPKEFEYIISTEIITKDKLGLSRDFYDKAKEKKWVVSNRLIKAL